MKLGNFLRFNAAILLDFGTGFVLAPEFMTSLYGAKLTDMGLVLARLLGAAFLGFGILRGRLSNVEAGHTRTSVLLSAMVEDVIATVVLVIAQLNGLMNAMGWSNVALYGFFAGGFIYFFLRSRA